MAIQCPSCRKQYDVTLFQFDRVVICDCGEIFALTQSQKEITSELLRRDRVQEEELRRIADKVCSLIIDEDYPRIDVEIATAEVKAHCQEFFPEKMYLYEMIYESRFQRLWKQFREE